MLMLSTMSEGWRRARGPVGYPEQPGKTITPARERP